MKTKFGIFAKSRVESDAPEFQLTVNDTWAGPFAPVEFALFEDFEEALSVSREKQKVLVNRIVTVQKVAI